MIKRFGVLLSLLSGIGLALAVNALRPSLLGSPGQKTMAMVVVAQKRLEAGTGIRQPEEVFSLCERDQEIVPAGAFTTLEPLKDQILKSSLRTGQIVTSDNILRAVASPSSSCLPLGFQAVGLPIHGKTSLLQKGMVVELFLHKGNEKICKKVISEMAILDIEGPTITVGMKTEDILKIVHAKEIGSLYFLKTAKSFEDILPLKRVTTEAVAKISQ